MLKYGDVHREIIVFFVYEINGQPTRVVRTAEFATDSPRADLQQLLCLLGTNLNIRYSCERSHWYGTSFLKEVVNFLNQNEIVHQINSDSHCLIEFPDGLRLTESALRSKSDEVERSIPFFIDRIFPGHAGFDPSQDIIVAVDEFLKKHHILVDNCDKANLTFTAVRQYNLNSFKRSLNNAVLDANPNRLRNLLTMLDPRENYDWHTLEQNTHRNTTEEIGNEMRLLLLEAQQLRCKTHSDETYAQFFSKNARGVFDQLFVDDDRESNLKQRFFTGAPKQIAVKNGSVSSFDFETKTVLKKFMKKPVDLEILDCLFEGLNDRAKTFDEKRELITEFTNRSSLFMGPGLQETALKFLNKKLGEMIPNESADELGLCLTS